jgi:hypothetical protein
MGIERQDVRRTSLPKKLKEVLKQTMRDEPNDSLRVYKEK